MSTKARILVVDDERSMQEFLEIFFRSEGYDVIAVGDVDTALVHLENDDFDVVISDIQMPGRSGIDLIHAAYDISPETVVIMITAFASTETAISAMKEGAYDYVTKPFKVDELRIVIDKALEKKVLSSENRRLRRELKSHSRHRSLIGNSASIRRVSDLITQVSDSKANVLISGESGTGKEIVAREIHQRGGRCDKPFVAVNCAAIPETLLESELFGHVKGAFTGAVKNKKGLFEVADGGTLFLDEVGELTLAVQVKLLRAIQEKSFRRVGASGDTQANVRIIAASNRRLAEEVAAGRFREDLYYRLNVIEIPLPPLRDRCEDIPLLVDHFIEKYAAELDNRVSYVTDEALARLMEYRFPGNVRELENVIERAVALSRSDSVDLESLPPVVLSPAESEEAPRITSGEGVDLEAMLNEYERGLLREAMQAAKGVKKRASKLVGVSFRSFRYRLEKLGLDHPDDGKA